MRTQEEDRLHALRRLRLLDTAPSEGFDRLTRMAAQLFALPISAVSLTDDDRQWFKSKVGVAHDSIPRPGAPCAEVAETTDVLVIPDLLADEDYRECTLAASGVRFYAGAPLVTCDGHGLGALCVLGVEPRAVTDEEIAALRDLAAIVMSQIELQHAYGRVDPVSGLPNRNQFREDLADLARDGTMGRRFVVLIDIGRTDQIAGLTGTHGTSAIETIVADTARRLEMALGPDRVLYHVGATQLAFVAPQGVRRTRYLQDLAAALRDLRDRAETRFLMTPAFGLALFEPGKTTPEDALRMAYSAAQVAQSRDEGVSLYSQVSDAEDARRHALLSDFGAALRSPDELRLVFQPRIELRSRNCVGAEALLRWQHPTLGAVSPGEFVPIVERSALAGPLTHWVIDAALAQLAIWRKDGHAIDLSVNVTATNLEDVTFVSTFESLLQRHRVPAEAIEIEITEGTVMGNIPGAMKTLNALRSLGTRVAIDDFGTGYSSLAYLLQLSVDTVKIDQSFVRSLADGERDRRLVRSIVALARDLGHKVVAEGVERASDADDLAAMGCDEAQGYLFAPPLEADRFVEWFHQHGEAPLLVA